MGYVFWNRRPEINLQQHDVLENRDVTAKQLHETVLRFRNVFDISAPEKGGRVVEARVPLPIFPANEKENKE